MRYLTYKLGIFAQVLCFSLFFLGTACSSESVLDELPTESVTDPDPDPSEEPDPDVTTPPDVSDKACDYDLSGLTPGGSLSIDCRMDLGGQTITLPADVTLEFNGGEIVNGTLVYAGGKIDGRLLNGTLEIEGPASLIDPVLAFDPDRWGIVQGSTTSDVALENRDILERVMQLVQRLEGHTLSISEMDAYFEVSKHTSGPNFYPSQEAINVPSEFTLVMSEQTVLRTFPNNIPKHSLLAIRNVNNTKVYGGTLIGDRDAHDYSSGGTHEWGILMDVHAAKNSLISGVTLKHATGDGMKIHSLNFSFDPDYNPSSNVTVTGCTFDANRRNNLSITDGNNIFIEDNLFLNAGIDTQNSQGTAPKFAIDVEAYRGRSGDEIIYYERAEDIFIRNNVERGSAAGGFLVYTGERVVMEYNQMETSMAWQYTNGTKIRNNTLKANAARANGTGIVGGRSDNARTTFNNEISGNRIEGYGSAITVFTNGNKVYDNEIINATVGISLRYVGDTEVYNNSITSTRESSKGVVGHIVPINTTDIYGNTIDVMADPVKFTRVNDTPEAAGNTFTVRDNILKSGNRATIADTYGFTFSNNELDHRIEFYNTTGANVIGNTIVTGSGSGIHLREANFAMEIRDNRIDNSSATDCIEVDATTSLSEVVLQNNECM